MKPSDLNGSFMDLTDSAHARPHYFNLTTDEDFDKYYSSDKSTVQVPPGDVERFATPGKAADSNHNGFATLNLNGTFVSAEPGVTSERDVDVFKTPTSTPRRRSGNSSPEAAADVKSEGRHSGRRRTMQRLAATFKTPTLTRNAHRKSMSHFDFFLHRSRKHRHSSLTPNVSVTSVGKTPDAKLHKSHPRERLLSIKGYFTSIYNGKEGGNKSSDVGETCETDCATVAAGDSSPSGIVKSPRKRDFSPIPYDIDSVDADPSDRLVDSPPSVRFDDGLTHLSAALFGGGLESSSTPKRTCHDVERDPRPFESTSQRLSWPAQRENASSCRIPAYLSPVPVDFQAITSRGNLADSTERGLQQLTNAPVLNTFTY